MVAALYQYENTMIVHVQRVFGQPSELKGCDIQTTKVWVYTLPCKPMEVKPVSLLSNEHCHKWFNDAFIN